MFLFHGTARLCRHCSQPGADSLLPVSCPELQLGATNWAVKQGERFLSRDPPPAPSLAPSLALSPGQETAGDDAELGPATSGSGSGADLMPSVAMNLVLFLNYPH